MLSLHTDAAAMSTENAISSTQDQLNGALTDLGTGYRVNTAMDDPAGLQIATRLQAWIGSAQQAQQNTQDGVALLQTADGSLTELTNILETMKDLATEAADGSTSGSNALSLQEEYNALGQEAGNIIQTSSYAGEALFSVDPPTGSTITAGGLLAQSAGLTFQVGASSEETMNVNTTPQVTSLISALQSISDNFVPPGQDATVSATNPTGLNAAGVPISSTGNATSGTELLTQAGANTLIDTINNALNAVLSLQGQLGASANDLQDVNANLSNEITYQTTAKGDIMDVDYASESSTATSLQLQLQAGTSALKQASDSMQQMVQTLMSG